VRSQPKQRAYSKASPAKAATVIDPRIKIPGSCISIPTAPEVLLVGAAELADLLGVEDAFVIEPVRVTLTVVEEEAVLEAAANSCSEEKVVH
jgi:hypothetical protein